MATEVISAHQPDGQLFHQPGSRQSSPSSSSLFLGGSPPSLSSSSTPKPQLHIPSHIEHHEHIPSSPPLSSVESSPRTSTLDFSNTSSFNSTPISSGLSLEERLQSDDDEDIDFPNYDSIDFARHDSGYETSRKAGEDDVEAPEISTTTDTTQSESPLLTPTVADDTAIKTEPSRHVDYLSHSWREEDIWSSWRHIVSQRKVYGQKSRLENASWRTWAKSKYNLSTVSPEKLNWLKESDVTWLYGPLKPAVTHPITSSSQSQSSSQISKSGSFINKKPILKKRSVSEVMLQKSLSSSSLLKQAAASVQAQQVKTPVRTNSEYTFSSSSAPSRPPSRDDTDYFSSRPSSIENGTPSECKESRHIRFDENVEQCIAVECKEDGPLEDEESEPETEDDPPESALSESSSEEGLVMMKRQKRRVSKKGKSGARLSRSNSGSKMIETIPSTTLKYRTDSPDVTQEQQHHVFGKSWNTAKLSPSPSQETLRPSRPSRNFLLADDEDEDDGDSSNTWSFGASNPKSSLGASASTEPPGSRIRGEEFNPTDGYDGIEGMRRTESGMFMPYDEDEDDMVAAGLFGRVSETINTFRDIGHVLWNVGWRK